MDEIARWQQAIYELCQEHYPDVDGSGCDSGDELDLTLADISEVFNMYQDRIDELEAALIPLVNAWRYVSSHHSENIVKNANLEEHYFWKPSSTAEQIPGLSWADAKRAHDLFNPTLPTPSPWDNDASAAELPY